MSEKDKGLKKAISNQNKEKHTFIDKGCYAIIRKLKQGQERSIALTLKLKNGEQIAIWYYEIVSPIRLPHPNKLEFQTTNLKVSVSGENLQDLFQYLIEQKLAWVMEAESNFTPSTKDQISIKQIMVDVPNEG